MFSDGIRPGGDLTELDRDEPEGDQINTKIEKDQITKYLDCFLRRGLQQIQRRSSPIVLLFVVVVLEIRFEEIVRRKVVFQIKVEKTRGLSKTT